VSHYDLKADKRYEFACKNTDTGCGGRTNFSHKLCIDCWEEQQRAAWEKYPVVQWDGEGMICSLTTNEYYDDLESAIDDLFNDDEGDIDDLQLVVCVPLKPPHFSLSDWVEGYTHDDWEMDKEDGEIEDTINLLLQSVTGLGYEPGKTRPDTTSLQAELDALRAKEKAGG
jgi:hypothetical protein